MAKTNGDPWSPQIKCDLTAGQQGFQRATQRFRDWAAQQERPVITLGTGWHTITPHLAEQLLICNRNNRNLRYPAVLRYGTDMANKRWKKTGEPVIITDRGDVEDAAHRLFACYFSGCSFDTFVVTDVPHDAELFACIDNGVSRTGDDTLHCAGLNGMSKHLESVIKKFAIRYDENTLAFQGRMATSPISNGDILNYARANPTIVEAAHLMADLYPAAIQRLDDRVVATFLGWKIHEAQGSSVLEDFMTMLTQAGLPNGHPVLALQQALEQHEAAKSAVPKSAKAKLKLSDVKILALAIRAFNFWHAGALNVRRLDPRMQDAFPRIENDESEEEDLSEAAE